MKLIMENWKKFISEDVLEEITTDYMRTKFYDAVNKANTPEEKIQVAQKIMAILKSNNPEQLKTLFKATFSDKNKDNWAEIAKRISDQANKMNPKILQNIKDEVEENDVDGVAGAIDDAVEAAVEDTPAEAEVSGGPIPEPETGAEEEAESPAEPEIEIKPLLDRFFNFLTRTGVLRESIGSLIKALGAKDTKLVGSSLSKNFKREQIKALVKYFEDKENVLSFVNQYFANDPEKDQIIQKLTAQSAEQPAKEGEVEVVDDGRKYTYTDKNIQDLKTAYQKFEDGFMTAPNRVEQENYWIELRNTLNAIGQFREIGRQERAYIGEQLINIFENENQQNFKRIVVDIERLRRDLNDTDDTLIKYLEAAKEGKYESQAYLARFLAELKDVQNSVKRTVEDVQKVGGFKLNEDEQPAAEPKEETFEQKVAKVRGVYENIKSQFSETLTQLDKTNAPELEEFSGRIKDAYDQLESIRYLFSRVGAFAKTSNKDVDELQEDYKIAKGKLTKAMSRTLSDLRAGQVDPNQLKVFLTDLLGVADWISTNFGVGPDEQYRVQGVTVQSDGKDKKQVAQDTDDSGGEPLTPEGSDEAPAVEPELEDDFMDLVKSYIQKGKEWIKSQFEEPESSSPLDDNERKALEKAAETLNVPIPDRKEPEAETGPRPDDITDAKVLTKFLFDNNSDYFKPSEMARIFGRENADAFKGIRRLLLTLLYSKILQDRDEASADIPISNEPLQEKERETDRQRLSRFGQDAGYKPIVIQKFLEFIEGRNYKSKGRDGIETTPYSDLLNAITTLDDTKLKQVFSKLKQVEDDLKQADVAFNVDSSKIKQKIKSLMVATSSNTREFAESKKHNNLLERLIKQELKVLNGKKMVRN